MLFFFSSQTSNASRVCHPPTISLGNLFQCLTTLSEKFYFSIQSELFPVQLQAISPYPFTWDMVEDHDHLMTSSFQAVVESHEVPSEPPFLQLKHPIFLSCSSWYLCFRPFPSSIAPLRNTQPLNVCLEVRGPKLHTLVPLGFFLMTV